MFGEAILIPVVLGITEGIKRAGVPSKYSVLVSLLIGLLLSWFASSETDAIIRVVEGLILGLSASGLYSGSKAVMLK